ncbi:hypothetical protein EMIT0232MI5_90027 [Pseudomonas sp. IT-232MI5]
MRVTLEDVKKLLPQSIHVTEAGVIGNETPAFFRPDKTVIST